MAEGRHPSHINMPSVLLLEAVCIFLFAGAPPTFPLQEIQVGRETIGKISAASRLTWCSAAVDILFLLDGSHSIGKGSFERAKHFAITVCDALDVSPDRVRVGAVQFSSTPWLEFPLDAWSTQQEVKTELKRIVFRGGRTETDLALKYFLRKGFPGGRNASVPQVLIIITDGRSQGHVALPAKQLQERGITVFAVGVRFPRWEELHTLASEPREQHVLMAEQVEDATNGLFSTLGSSDICTFASPDCKVQPHPCERKTLETVRELVGNAMCWRGSRGTNGVLAAPCPFSSWKKVFLTHPATCYRTICPGPCDSQPCRNGGTCVPEGLDRYHCLCPPAFRGEANCAPTLSLQCRIDVLFLLASSAGTTPEGFLQAKAFVKRFVQASLNEDSRARVGVARYSQELEVAVPVGEYQDVPHLVRSLDAIPFSGGATLTGRALRQVAERGFGSARRTGQDRPRRVVVLLTESRSEDEVAGPARHARAQELLLLGMGSEAVRAELEEITGSPEHVMVYADPQDLFDQIPELQGKLCSRPRPGCQAQSLDLVFVLDASASVGPENFAQMQSFVRSCTLQFDVNPDVTQIGLVAYGSQVQTVFGLDSHVTRPAVLRAMSQAPYLGGVGSAGTALLHIYDKVMTVQRGARPGVPKAVVVLTGGRGAEDAAVPAQKLRNNGVSVLVVGVGAVLRDSLRRLAGPRDSLIHVAAYTDLRFHQDTLVKWLCGEAKRPINLCKPSPCMNEGTCVLRNGSYLCTCRDGWEGPHCENRAMRGDALQPRGSRRRQPAAGHQPGPTQHLRRRPGHQGR
ncbi:von Willebrand factor A domain-containing protein 2 [Artibeus jamaicensis]|uniref:von Willebrand factor A domain-containing protein 2 n=1 Tax=Artibeus jamaicensis TaxID=9417 RepID=UPI00235B022C|nr:von Willebrand factor A domain-containing protein 2 [Artibeus jamaicensis]XP_053524421.1 von Willebrand factor A domain-containing protein 2 [Artibeus jamaicensis]XP_053524422.1 von Willebrand factor A domain-containing protein 2 [Artibeus jamaicensis]